MGGKGDDRGWDGWMASLTQWTWVRVSSGSWWWTGKPGMLQSMRSQSWAWPSDWNELNYQHSNPGGTSNPMLFVRPTFPPSLLPQSPYSHHLAYLKWLFPCCLAGSINSGYSCLWLSFQLWLFWYNFKLVLFMSLRLSSVILIPGPIFSMFLFHPSIFVEEIVLGIKWE